MGVYCLAKRSYMDYSRKNPNRRGWGHSFYKKTPGIFRFVVLPLEIVGKMKLHPWKFHKIVLHLLEFPRPKAKTHGNPHDFFWFTPVISTSFLLTPEIFAFFIYSVPLLGSSTSSTPLFGFYSEITPYSFLNKNIALFILEVFYL